MENQPTSNPQICQQPGSAPVEDDTSPKQKTSLLFPVLITLLVSAIVFGIGGYYLGINKTSTPLPNDSADNTTTTGQALQPSVTPVFEEEPMSSEIGNAEMGQETTVVTNDGMHKVWLDGEKLNSTQLWVSNADGTQKKLLVSGNLPLSQAKVGDYSLASPIWSPDSTKIAYLRAVIDEIGQFDITDRLDLYIVDRDGMNDHLVKTNITIARGRYGKTDLTWINEGISYTDYSTSATGSKVVIQPK